MSKIHQEVVFEASPKRIYEALTDGKQFSAFSGGAPADISAEAGGSFSCFGGMVSRAKYRAGTQPTDRPGMARQTLGKWRLFDRQVRATGGGLRDPGHL